jgi:CO/xanthine dehydrogenase Mo-binding subunit
MAEQDRPWTWKVPEGSDGIKKSMTRQDGFDRVSGHAVFTRDICLPGMLYAKILISPFAHARIVSMDTSKAEALVGVRDILKYDDPDIASDNVTGVDFSNQYNILTLPGISDFYHHPMGVAVVADSEEICDRALKLIGIKWEERPFVLDMEEALKPDAPKIMPEVRRLNRTAKDPNLLMTEDIEIGDVQKGFAEADRVIEYTIKRGTNTPAGVEAMVCVAQWREDFLDLWLHHQPSMQSMLSSPSFLEAKDPSRADRRDKVLPPFAEWSKITLTFPYQGSWYGGLAWLAYSTSFVRLAVILARRSSGRPVKLLYDESNFYCNNDEEGVYKCKVGARKDGTITAGHWHMIGMRNPIIEKTHECTAIPNLRGTMEWPLISKGFGMCFRHGAACCIPHNIMFDRVAAELGLDPTEVALKNDGCLGHNWDHVTRYQKENGFPQRQSLKEVIELGKKAIDWDRKWHPPDARKLPNGRMHGMGFMSIHEWRWHGGSNLACLILRNGKANIVGSRSDMGVDSESGFRQCVAAELGLKYEDTLIQERRSDVGVFSLSQPAGSMGTIMTTPQLVMAARELKRKILEAAVKAPKVEPGALTMVDVSMRNYSFAGMGKPPSSDFVNKKPEELDIRDSMIFEKVNPNNKKTVREVADMLWNSEATIAHPTFPSNAIATLDGKPLPEAYIMSRQAHFIELEVDTETGMVEVTNVVCVNDVGHVFNPEGAMGQQYGGAVMGLGRSATEEKIYCPRTGVGLNNDLIGYHMGTMNDYPFIHTILNESHLGYSAYGAYGIGEDVGAALSGITASGIYNATGKWVLDHPTTPDRVLKALGKI